MRYVLPLQAAPFAGPGGYTADLPVYPHPGSGYIHQPFWASHHSNGLTGILFNVAAMAACSFILYMGVV